MSETREETIARFMKFVRVTENGCWEWQGGLVYPPRSTPYGHFSFGKASAVFTGQQMTSHKAAYLLFVGQVPPGLELDHLCRNTICACPTHLEAVTHRENVLRGVCPSAKNAQKTHCKRGHEFTPENTYPQKNRSGNGRACRTCEREKSRRLQRKYIVERPGYAEHRRALARRRYAHNRSLHAFAVALVSGWF